MTGLWRGAHPLVLASKSVARRKLLAASGIPFEIRPAGIDERTIEAPLIAARADAQCIARQLSRAKALEVGRTRPGRIIIGADQTLDFNGRVLGKPPDRQAAMAQLQALSGQTHTLCSGCCVVRGDAVLFQTVEIARLTCRKLGPEFVEAYMKESGDAILNCAGAYQVEGLGIHLFEKIEGDHSTILGLPLLPLLAFLRADGSLLS
ncbi:MAG TPA: Maf family protein [Methylocella sp.]|nr:Maf family protein [Methylocella sp.]